MTIIAATNCPYSLPESVLRRFYYVLYVPLPTLCERVAILKKYMQSANTNITEKDFVHISKDLKGYRAMPLDGNLRKYAFISWYLFVCRYSGADLEKLARVAVELRVMKIINATHFKPVSQDAVTGLWEPCSHRDRRAESRHFKDFQEGQLQCQVEMVFCIHNNIRYFRMYS